ncbi:DUF3293 domain-containing protein [Aeromonas taiwanensis]
MTLWENYRKVCFIAPSAPPDWPAYAIVTAWNPASRWVGPRRNARRQRALMRRVDELPVLPVWGSDEDERWQEASLLLPLSQAEAVRLAVRFGQNALYWVEAGELWLVPALLQGAPCHLGRLAPRWRIRPPA